MNGVHRAPGVIDLELDAVFRHTSGGGAVFNVPPVIKVTVENTHNNRVFADNLVGLGFV